MVSIAIQHIAAFFKEQEQIKEQNPGPPEVQEPPPLN